MIHYPQDYTVQAKATYGTQSQWSAQAEGIEIPCAIPPGFQGPGKGLSPEDLYALAILNCFFATFKVFSEKSNAPFETLQGQARLTVDRDEKGVPWMARCHLKLEVTGASDSGRIRTLLEKTSRSCLVLNSIRTEKTFEFLC